MASTASLQGYLHQSAYVASKHAMLGLARSLAMELKPHGIHVHNLCPGGVDTDLIKGTQVGERMKGQPMISPEDMAAMVLFLLKQPENVDLPEIVVRRFRVTRAEGFGHGRMRSGPGRAWRRVYACRAALRVTRIVAHQCDHLKMGTAMARPSPSGGACGRKEGEREPGYRLSRGAVLDDDFRPSLPGAIGLSGHVPRQGGDVGKACQDLQAFPSAQIPQRAVPPVSFPETLEERFGCFAMK